MTDVEKFKAGIRKRLGLSEGLQIDLEEAISEANAATNARHWTDRGAKLDEAYEWLHTSWGDTAKPVPKPEHLATEQTMEQFILSCNVNMTFSQALIALKQGKNLARAGSNTSVYLKQGILYERDKDVVCPWQLVQDDVLASDWLVLENYNEEDHG